MRELPLSRGLVALVDDEDFERVGQLKWSAAEHGYAFRNVHEQKTTEYLHHRVLGRPPLGYVVDHINGNKLDNRRENLRVVSYARNLRNRKAAPANSSTGVLGVSRKRGRWRAYLSACGKQINLGTYQSLDEAKEARRRGELKFWGENSFAHA